MTLLLAAMAPAAAQKKSTSPLTYFYLDPKPEKLVGFLDSYAKNPTDWMAYPPMVGFYAIVFRQFPDWVDRLSPSVFDSKTAVTVAVAYKLSALSPMPAPLHDRLFSTQPDPRLQAEFPHLPARVEDVAIRTPTDLDVMWGAFSASGDERYVRKILAFLAATIDPAPELGIDVTRLTVALSNPDAGKKIFPELRAKYDDTRLHQLANASTAQWALVSNAVQHAKIRQIVDAYSAEHPDSVTTSSLAALLKK
ncbi:MAG: hypothetical protein JSR47_05505 [Proteobacteria bacterium]|nr:hypothetical protein [Pseudomonadota bacterium]